ncbi:hypothetical protein EG359_22360 (plasmid) [Chryseobacterium joostei]|uniref:Uncharacterized protein n=1 Tax=Chryseobacterium joostei TaxID=112234 RepID=A0A1N7KGI5_9FLAO|nr:hypothetical protein [Chryseobacterium joostei]AZB02404.1 hypothetical protein EG359_22360 [Chryseobacterium joostei]SIS60708.1 hypothetical protein SAMN05421768_11219 [Chryseobacterium joostei]
MEFKDLLIEHDYYCADRNFYNRKEGAEWDSFDEFLEVYNKLNPDLNFVFRWDLRENEEKKEKYILEIFMVFQRRGVFSPHIIDNITVDDFEKIKEFLQPRFEKLVKMWLPFKIQE